MSLFKVRDFWTFDLKQLAAQFKQDKRDDEGIGIEQDQTDEAKFVASLGKFHSIDHHEVIVCGHLNGFLCILQVPQSERQKFSLLEQTQESNKQENSPTTTTTTSSQHVREHSNNNLQDIKERQLLLAQLLPFPIVDIKCGFFTSALKQSVAVLSFDKVVVYQVKRNQIDLLSASDDDNNRSNLLSHTLEEHHRLELINKEIGANLVVLDRHADGRLSTRSSSSKHFSAGDSSSSKHHSEKWRHKHATEYSSGQQLHLPQRDSLLVQYTNQFLFTIVDHKKIVGHFSLYKSCFKWPTMSSLEGESEPYEGKHEQLSQFVGALPMAFYKHPNSADLSLALTLSDHTIHSIALSKLLTEVKQDVMRRVALNLLYDRSQEETQSSTEKIKQTVSMLAYHNKSSHSSEIIIDLNLDSIEEWKFELVCAPIEMLSIHRQVLNGKSEAIGGQLLVMSRYNLDLISSSGEHLWSQRFETPLISLCCYTIIKNKDSTNNSNSKISLCSTERERNSQKLLILACTDCLSSEKCNLLILEEDRIVWSALLNVIPLQIWRIKLANKMFSAICSLDAKSSQLNVSYLGTNLDTGCDGCEEDSDSSTQLAACLKQVEEAGEGFEFNNNALDEAQLEPTRAKLRVEVRLEASNYWPNVSVESRISIKPQKETFGLLQNIVATLEFDDLLQYKPSSHREETFKINEGAIELKIGNCWPDRREPLLISGQFSLKLSSRINKAPEQEENFPQLNEEQLKLMPKSLKVNLYLRFNESPSSCSFQEESFLLPLSMLAKLVHIDYSSGLNQSLEDVQANLNYYKRERYYLCDLFVRTQCDIMELIDEIIESDLICRGLNSESPDLLRNKRPQRRFSTLENINLLAQSLDCRLKYKSELHPSRDAEGGQLEHEDTSSPVVMISIALELLSGGQIMSKTSSTIDKEKQDNYTIAWLHLCDLDETDSRLPEELLQQHAREWKMLDLEGPAESFSGNKACRSILVSFESEYPVPVLLLQDHLINRLKARVVAEANMFHLAPLLRTTTLSAQMTRQNLAKLDNFIAIGLNLHERLRTFMEQYETDFKARYEHLRAQLPKIYYKFQISALTSLSISKRLSGFPDDMMKQFNNLSALTKQHQQELMKLLSELERFKKLDYQISKIPKACDVLLELQKGQLSKWPDFVQVVD